MAIVGRVSGCGFLAGLLFVAACGGGSTPADVPDAGPDAPAATVVVVVDGPTALDQGGTATLTATTVNGQDSGYDWTSSNEAVATVDAQGVVTGVGGGEAVITATGRDSKQAGRHGVVVQGAGIEVPFQERWQGSGHADREAEAFTHWNEDGEIPVECARCHSTPGFRDYVGADGSAVGTVEKAAPTGSVIECIACHNAATLVLDTVTFPSGKVIGGLGSEARCMTCHQGVESTKSVDEAIAAAAPANDDTASEALGFRNVHYFAAGATLYGTQAAVGYQYAGKSYDAKFRHVPSHDTCLGCHDPHTLEKRVDTCTRCHAGVDTVEEVRGIRMLGSRSDYDGDGNVSEGIHDEVAGIHATLYRSIQAYARDKLASPLVYDGAAYPYFFKDTNANGAVDEGEATFANRYAAWSPRLLRAAFNYQFVEKDPGGYVHNAKYEIELTYDAIEDLNGSLATPVDLSKLARTDPGHFAGSEEAWRHWDEDGTVPASCSRCHSANGLGIYVQTGGTLDEPPSNGMMCSTCHPVVPDFTQRIAVAEVTFPSGKKVDAGPTSNLCMTCHQGVESTPSVDEAVAGMADDGVQAELAFINVHYFAAGATLYGTEAQGGYEYAGRRYRGRFNHVEGYRNCNECHDVHGLTPKVAECAACHEGVATLADLQGIRMAASTPDYNGNGDVDEGVAREIDGLRDRLYAAMQAYATQKAGQAIAYDDASYPYFFKDTNGNGQVDAGEAAFPNRYASWTPRLLKAAYNFQFSRKDPGAFAHNGKYVIELLYDALADLGTQVTVDLAGLVRDDPGHFDPTAEAFRHWDAEGAVPAGCARCHSNAGFRAYLETYANPTEAQPIAARLECETCHASVGPAAAPLRVATQVTFPSGVKVENDATEPSPSFLCVTCHQGRVAAKQIDDAITAGEFETFPNVHYLSAGASLWGSDAHVGYEYPGKTYAGKWTHVGPTTVECTFCHEVTPERHAFLPAFQAACEGCHDEATDLASIRKNRPLDYNGNGDAAESLRAELQGLADALLGEIRAVASANGSPLAFSAAAYPYYFNDLNGNGTVDPAEAKVPNAFKSWTPGLLKAAHNFQIHAKEPGEWAHNTDYAAQLLIDSIEDLGGDVTGLQRP